jgi:hypothetical protein
MAEREKIELSISDKNLLKPKTNGLAPQKQQKQQKLNFTQ